MTSVSNVSIDIYEWASTHVISFNTKSLFKVSVVSLDCFAEIEFFVFNINLFFSKYKYFRLSGFCLSFFSLSCHPMKFSECSVNACDYTARCFALN